MFDVTALTDVVIQSFDINASGAGDVVGEERAARAVVDERLRVRREGELGGA